MIQQAPLPPYMVDAFEERLAALRHRPKRHNKAEIAWLSGSCPMTELLDAMAAAYVRRFKATADDPTAILSTHYPVGADCIEHHDQGGGGTPDRTVTASLILEPAEEGGELTVQDHERRFPKATLNPPRGTLIMFPADWWHQVLPVTKGLRRSAVRWWRDPRFERLGRPFRSKR